MNNKPTYQELETKVNALKNIRAKYERVKKELALATCNNRKKTEETLRETTDYLESLINYANAPIIVWDTDFIITRFNAAFEKLTGRSSEEVVGQNLDTLFPENSRDDSLIKIRQTLKGEKWESVEIPILRSDDDIRIALWNSANIYAEDGSKLIATIAQGQDITDLLKMNQQLLQAQKMEAIGTLAGGVAHDFNNILSAIIGYSELAKDRIPPGNPAQKDIDIVIESSVRAANLVKQILTFGRKSKHHLQPFMPHMIVKESLKMLRSSLPTTLSLKGEIDIDCGLILADPTNIHQIVVNLCTNAFHSMENEKGILTVNLYCKDIGIEEINDSDIPPGPFIVLSVSDTGHGMDKKTIERVFEPYFTTKSVGKGTGLGLSVIHGIVKDYKGFIQIESFPGKGTTFYIHFPALQQVDSIWEKGEKPELPSMGTERILVVDDEDVIVNLNKTTLERLGYTVTATTNSKEALKIIRLQPGQFDLIITDQTMPGLSGIELSEEVLKFEPNMPIILCTGYSSNISEATALATGIKKYARKPISRLTMAKIVRQVLDDNQK